MTYLANNLLQKKKKKMIRPIIEVYFAGMVVQNDGCQIKSALYYTRILSVLVPLRITDSWGSLAFNEIA